MKLIIDIPDHVYDCIINHYETFPCEMRMWSLRYIKDGIKIPKVIRKPWDCDNCNFCTVSDGTDYCTLSNYDHYEDCPLLY